MKREAVLKTYPLLTNIFGGELRKDQRHAAADGRAGTEFGAFAQVQAAVAAGTERGNEVMAHLGAITGLPMAANFNLVPPALLEMTDKYRQIKVQLPTAGLLFVVNVALLLTLPFM